MFIKSTFKKCNQINNISLGSVDFETIQLDNRYNLIAVGLKIDNYQQWSFSNYLLQRNTELRLIESILVQKLFYVLLSVPYLTFIYFHNLYDFNNTFILNFMLKNLDKIAFSSGLKIILRAGIIYQIKISQIFLQSSSHLLSEKLETTILLSSRYRFRKRNSLYLFFFANYKLKRISVNNYLQADVCLLIEILKFFRRSLFNNFNIDVTFYMSISSITFKIFRNNFLKSYLLTSTSPLTVNYISKAYFGGVSFVHFPFGNNLFRFDINSLYPFVMSNNLFPTNHPIWISIYNFNLSLFFGFCQVSFLIPEFLIFGVIPFKFKGRNINGIGLISGVYFSEELKFFISLGCKVITIFSALKFNRSYIFNNFVNSMYGNRLRAKSIKNKFSQSIFKLILNSLHGRLGMQQKTIINFKAYSLIKFTRLKSLTLNCSRTINYLLKQPKLFINTSLQISSAVASYSRVNLFHLLYFIYSKDIKIFFCNTDSVICNKPLPLNFMSRNSIGFLKCEFKNLIGVFITTRNYFLQNSQMTVKKFCGLSPKPYYNLNYSDFDFLLGSKIVFSISYHIKTNFQVNSNRIIIFKNYCHFMQKKKFFFKSSFNF